jgi:hypothetical protein
VIINQDDALCIGMNGAGRGQSVYRFNVHLLLKTWRSHIATHHVIRHNAPIHNILSTAPQLNISQKALETFPEDDNVMPKHVGATIHN